jgi:hypothetical protein
MHEKTKQTLFEGFYQLKPNLIHLKVFGFWLCVKRTGKRCGKLEGHDFNSLTTIRVQAETKTPAS